MKIRKIVACTLVLAMLIASLALTGCGKTLSEDVLEESGLSDLFEQMEKSGSLGISFSANGSKTDVTSFFGETKAVDVDLSSADIQADATFFETDKMYMVASDTLLSNSYSIEKDKFIEILNQLVAAGGSTEQAIDAGAQAEATAALKEMAEKLQEYLKTVPPTIEEGETIVYSYSFTAEHVSEMIDIVMTAVNQVADMIGQASEQISADEMKEMIEQIKASNITCDVKATLDPETIKLTGIEMEMAVGEQALSVSIGVEQTDDTAVFSLKEIKAGGQNLLKDIVVTVTVKANDTAPALPDDAVAISDAEGAQSLMMDLMQSDFVQQIMVQAIDGMEESGLESGATGVFDSVA